MKTKTPKKPSRKKLVAQLDSIFSQYIRLKDTNGSGLATCVTCGNQQPWKQMQNGHFYSRSRQATRWDEDNCHVQDYRCNVALNGNYIIYTKYMIDRYGREFVDDLERRSHMTTKIPTVQLQLMLEEYKIKVKELGG